MTDAQSPSTSAPPSAAKLDITIYQIAPDDTFKANRSDGAGWDLSWAPLKRDWMEQGSAKYAYRCLPLSIANQVGWWVRNPIGFQAMWTGEEEDGGVQFMFDSAPRQWSIWVNNQFGHGIITWKTPFLFRTKPAGSRLLVTGPANYFKHGVQPMTAIIESDWMTMSFTMNWKITATRTPVRFEAGEPIFQVIPTAGNICTDLEEAAVRYMTLGDDPPVNKAYHDWYKHRAQFIEDKNKGTIAFDAWQKNYFLAQGLAAPLPQEIPGHRTKLNPPAISYPRSAPPGGKTPGSGVGGPGNT